MFTTNGVYGDNEYFIRITKDPNPNNATPLAWSHAEYVKLLRSLKDQQVWDFYTIVSARYQQP